MGKTKYKYITISKEERFLLEYIIYFIETGLVLPKSVAQPLENLLERSRHGEE